MLLVNLSLDNRYLLDYVLPDSTKYGMYNPTDIKLKIQSTK
jgi:hypothetical protein